MHIMCYEHYKSNHVDLISPFKANLPKKFKYFNINIRISNRKQWKTLAKFLSKQNCKKLRHNNEYYTLIMLILLILASKN